MVLCEGTFTPNNRIMDEVNDVPATDMPVEPTDMPAEEPMVAPEEAAPATEEAA